MYPVFDIILGDFSPGRPYPGIDAKVNLNIGDDTLIEEREFSIFRTGMENYIRTISTAFMNSNHTINDK